jgi:hypothetical protein
LNYTLKRTALHSFLNPVSFDPPLVGLLMDGQAVAHQAGSQICRDAPAQQPEGVGVTQGVWLGADAVSGESISESFA